MKGKTMLSTVRLRSEEGITALDFEYITPILKICYDEVEI